jgi:hypothetical protein
MRFQRSGEGDGFAEVVEAADPGYDSLDTLHAEAGVGDAAVWLVGSRQNSDNRAR